MRHRAGHRKLGRRTGHRIALLRNLAASLIDHGRIRTTEAKAKELRPFVERLVTLGKRDSLHARRHALSILPRREAVQKLFNDVSPRFSERPGGYTRILKLAHRQGDGAAMAFIEFVDFKLRLGETSAAAPGKGARAEKKPEKPEKQARIEAKEAEDPDEAEAAEEPKKRPAAKQKPAAKATKAAKKEPAAEKKPAKKATKKTSKKKNEE